MLIGTKKTRLGPRPCEEHFDYLEGIVNRYVAADIPIELITMWGGQKGYGVCDGFFSAEIMDVMAMRRFAAVNAMVQQLHRPGIHVRVVWEDLTEMVMSHCGTLNVSNHVHTYREHLVALMNAMGINYVDIVCETTLLCQQGVSISGFLSDVCRYSAAMYDYWQASRLTPTSEWEQLSEYTTLRSLGWTGIIPQEQREYYIQRAKTENPLSDTDEHIKGICTYFAIALARYQHKMLRATANDANGAIPPIKMSFVPYPPGTPHAMSKGRVELKVKDGKGSNKTIPPWAGFAVFVGNDASLISVNGWRQVRHETERASIGDVEVNVLTV
jgi:hypothetical protein